MIAKNIDHANLKFAVQIAKMKNVKYINKHKANKKNVNILLLLFKSVCLVYAYIILL